MDFLSLQASCGPLCWAAGWVVGVGVAVVDMLLWVLWLSDLTCLTELGLEMSVTHLLQSSQSVVEAARYLSAGAVLFQLKLQVETASFSKQT